MSKKIIAYFKIFLKILVPVIVFTYLFKKYDGLKIIKTLMETNLLLFVLSTLILCLRNWVGAYRSRILLLNRQMDYSSLVLTKYYFIGNFFNLFLPEIIGRDIARGVYLFNSSDRKSETVGSILVERFIGTVALIVLGLMSIIISIILGIDIFKSSVIKVIFVMFLCGFIIFLLFFNRKTDMFFERIIPEKSKNTFHKFIEFIHDMVRYGRTPIVIWKTMGISLVFQFMGVFAAYLVAASISYETKFVYYLILIPVIWMISMIPVSINGLGLREGSFVALFCAVGMSAETALSISLLMLFQNVLLGIMGGIIFIFQRKSDKIHDKEKQK